MSLSGTLSDKDAEVIAADINKETVQEAADFFEDAVFLDATKNRLC